MTHKIEGIIPVMLTPFTDQGEIDYPGLERLIEWYLEKGADALFAIAQSSEMQLLTLAERAALKAETSVRPRDLTLTMPLHGIGQSPQLSFFVMYLSTSLRNSLNTGSGAAASVSSLLF